VRNGNPDIEAEQAPSGAFPCLIDFGGGVERYDENGFTTALVLRRLRRLRMPFPGIARSLDFLESCASEPHGAFSFWPPTVAVAQETGLPADADDTATITLELYAQGRRSREQARATVVDVLVAAAAAWPLSPPVPWWRPGAFPTWLRADGLDRDRVVDCAVNANVVALMASIDARDLPGYAEAVAMITAAVEWCAQASSADTMARVDAIAPYYASPGAVVRVLDDAVWCGVSELAPVRDHLATLVETRSTDDTALWRNAYSGPVWRCRALQLLAAHGAPPSAPGPT
jgi:hypothetical protein